LAAPEKLTIDTPEQIALEYTLASAGSRFLAVAIDTLLQLAAGAIAALLAILGGAAALFTGGGFALWVQALLILVWFALFYGYFALFESLWNGQTPGKRAIRLRVITLSGRPITVFDAILRNLVRIVDQIPGIYAVGLASMFLSPKNQRLGDLAAGTVVVHEQGLSHGPGAKSPAAGGPLLGAHRLQPNEIEALEVFLKRRDDLPVWRRDKTAGQLATHVRARLGIPLERQPSDEQLLEELVAEYRSRGR
jgi:uncharacterized RDD family membrane protein YckC